VGFSFAIRINTKCDSWKIWYKKKKQGKSNRVYQKQNKPQRLCKEECEMILCCLFNAIIYIFFCFRNNFVSMRHPVSTLQESFLQYKSTHRQLRKYEPRTAV